MPGVPSASGSGIWSRRRDEITFDRLQKVRSRGRRLGSIRVMANRGLVGACARRVISGTELGALPAFGLIGCSRLASHQKLHGDGVLGT